MSEVKEKLRKKYIRYILLFLLILLTGLGIWRCPNLSNKDSDFNIAKEKEDNLELETSIKSDAVVADDKNPPTKSELKIPKKEDKSIASKPKKENDFITPNKKNEKSPGIEMEESSKREEIILNEESPKKEVIVYKANKDIDRRLPASSDISCNATTIFKIDKSSIQTSVAISPDGTNFAVGNHNNYASIMNVEGEELFKLIGHKGYVSSIKYSPDGKFLVSGSMDNTAKLWDASNGKEIKNMEGHTEGILSIAYSLNGKYIATGSLDHTTILWGTKSGKKLFQLRGHKSEVAEVAFSTNSKNVITGGSDGTAKVWDVESGEILYSLEGHKGVVGGVAFTPNDKLIVTGSVDKIRLWNAKTGKHIHTINDKGSRIMSIFVSNDGEYISSSNVNGLIKIWKIKGGKEVCKLEGHSTRARETVFHPTKKNTVVSAGNDNTIRMWKFELE